MIDIVLSICGIAAIYRPTEWSRQDSARQKCLIRPWWWNLWSVNSENRHIYWWHIADFTKREKRTKQMEKSKLISYIDLRKCHATHSLWKTHTHIHKYVYTQSLNTCSKMQPNKFAFGLVYVSISDLIPLTLYGSERQNEHALCASFQTTLPVVAHAMDSNLTLCTLWKGVSI